MTRKGIGNHSSSNTFLILLYDQVNQFKLLNQAIPSNNKVNDRSLEQILARVTLTIAYISCCIVGFGFSKKPNFPLDMYV